jgi:hypothetical protein
LPLRDELHGDRVHAVAGVARGEAFAPEDVAEVTAAVLAGDLDPATVGIEALADRALDRLVEARPTAARVELVDRFVERRVATPADEGADLVELLVFAAEGPLGALIDDDSLLVRGQGVKNH